MSTSVNPQFTLAIQMQLAAILLVAFTAHAGLVLLEIPLVAVQVWDAEYFVVQIGCELSSKLLYHIDVNECEQLPYPCHGNANCSNIFGSYQCSCKTGFTGDGLSCAGEGSIVLEMSKVLQLWKLVMINIQ